MANKVTASVIGTEELLASFRQLDQAVRGSTLAAAAEAGALPVLNAAKANAPKRTRTLARSLHLEVVQATDSYAEVEIGTDLEYARIQEYGGTITPKNAKYLAVPLTEAARAATSPLLFAGELHFVPRAGGGTGGTLRDDAGEAQYALVTSVTIPAHPYLRPAIDENEQAALDEMERVLARLLEAG